MSGVQVSAPPHLEMARPRRLAASVWLPWIAGLVVLLILAAFSGVLAGRSHSQSGVTRSVLTAQKRLALTDAELFRQRANESVADVEHSAEALVAAPEAPLAGTMEEMLARQERWAGLEVVGARGTVIATVGSLPDAVPTLPATRAESGLLVVEANGMAQLVSYAPLVRLYGTPSVLLGVSDRAILDTMLVGTATGSTYVADSQGRVLAARGARGVPAVLPPGPLLDAGRRASNGAVSTTVVKSPDGATTVISSAPVSGSGPAGSMDLAVVVERTIAELPSLGFLYRTPGIIYAITIGLLTIVLFDWIRRRVMVPLVQLRNHSQHVAYEDLSDKVPIGPFDELGKISLALERIRIELIKRRLVPAHRLRTSPPATDGDVPPADRQIKILVADNDPKVRSILEAALAQPARAVRTVADGQQAIDAALSDLPTLIILDWSMPELSGIDACRFLKSDYRTADIPVIMLTAFGSEEHIAAAFDCGADNYVTKPFEIREIVAAVDAVLSTLGAR